MSKNINNRAKSVKLAYQEACRDAYSQLLFVTLNSGKLYIEVFRRQSQDGNCDVSDELFNNQVQVNVLKEEPISEDKLDSDWITQCTFL